MNASLDASVLPHQIFLVPIMSIAVLVLNSKLLKPFLSTLLLLACKQIVLPFSDLPSKIIKLKSIPTNQESNMRLFHFFFFFVVWLLKCKYLASKSQSKLRSSFPIGSYMLNVYIFDFKFLQKNWNSLIFDSRLFDMDFIHSNFKFFVMKTTAERWKQTLIIMFKYFFLLWIHWKMLKNR